MKANTAFKTDAGVNLGLGRVASSTCPAGVVAKVGYDGNVTATGNAAASGNGLVTSNQTGPNLSTKIYDYRGRVTEQRGVSVADETAASVVSCVHYTYDVLDRVSVEDRGAPSNSTLGNGCTTTSGSTQHVATKTVYDAAGHKTHSIVDLANSGVFTGVNPADTLGAGTSCATGGAVDTSNLISQSFYTPGGRLAKTIETPVDQPSFNWCTNDASAKRVTEHVFDITATPATNRTGRVSEVAPPSPDAKLPTFYSYDADGRVATQMLAYGTVANYTNFTYDPAGRVQTTTTPSSALSMNGSTDTTPLVTSISCYDAFGEKAYQSDPHTVTVPGTGPCTTRPDGTAAGFDYGTYNQYQSFDFYDNGSLKTAWSALRNASGANPELASTTYFYDGRGNRQTRISWTCSSGTACDTAHTKDVNHWHTVTEGWAYNPDDQLTGYTDPAGQSTGYAYYGQNDTAAGQFAGKLKTITQPSGRAVTALYRPDGQLAEQDYTLGGSDPVTLKFNYNAFGTKTKESDQTGTAAACASNPCANSYTYDRAGRMLTQTVPNRTAVPGTGGHPVIGAPTWTLTYALDLVGNLTQLTYGDGAQMQFAHDVENRMTTATLKIFSYWVPQAQYVYSPLGQLLQENSIGGLSQSNRTWTYKPSNYTGNLKTAQPMRYVSNWVDHAVYGGNPTMGNTDTSLTYNPDGRQASETTGSTTWSYKYDDAGQLLCRSNGTCPTPSAACSGGAAGDYLYAYNTRGLRTCDAAGSTVTTHGFNDNAQMLTSTTGASTTTATFDLDGRQTCTGTTDCTVFTNATKTTYDARGLPFSVITKTGGTTTTDNRTYDSSGRFVRTDNTATANDFLWDASGRGIPQILEGHVTQNGNQSYESFTRSYYGGERIAWDNTSPAHALSYYRYDAHGSSQGTQDTPGPDNYDPFGVPTGTNTAGPLYFGYRGELTINGQVHLRARDYNAPTGTFTRRDAISGDEGTTVLANPYHYTGNDPLDLVDPTGNHPGPAVDCDLSARQGMEAEISSTENQANAGNGGDGRPPSASLGQGRTDAQQRLALLKPTLADAGGVCIKSYSSSGRGRLVEVVGDLRSAQNVMVMVPGLNTNMANFTSTMQTDAKRVQGKTGGSTAVVAWLGYDAPQLSLEDNNVPGVTNDGLARQGAPLLAGFLGSLGGKHVTLSAHSYGSQVGTIAAAEFGAHPQDMILIGSPGVEQSNVSAYGASTTTWVGVTDDDPVAQHVPAVGAFRNKTQDSSFGAKRFRTGSASGHSEYYAEGTESLANIVNIATGNYNGVTTF